MVFKITVIGNNRLDVVFLTPLLVLQLRSRTEHLSAITVMGTSCALLILDVCGKKEHLAHFLFSLPTFSELPSCLVLWSSSCAACSDQYKIHGS